MGGRMRHVPVEGSAHEQAGYMLTYRGVRVSMLGRQVLVGGLPVRGLWL
jgi:hypothetical protein